MQINPSYKAYLVVSWLFLVSTAFTLAKMLRDDHEALQAVLSAPSLGQHLSNHQA